MSQIKQQNKQLMKKAGDDISKIDGYFHLDAIKMQQDF